MPRIRPFKALRPAESFAEKTFIYHGDAGDPVKYKNIIARNPYSMLNVSHAELFFSKDEPLDSSKIHEKAQENLKRYLAEGSLVQDEAEVFYVYRLTMANHSQTGLIACVDVEDYINGKIKNHELTREDKVHIQANVIHRVGGNLEPILLTYDSSNLKKKLIEEWAFSHDSMYDILDEGGIRHEVWQITDEKLIDAICKEALDFESLYICDGHHRIAASREYYLNHKDDVPASRYFMAVIFPTDEMLILDYNRAVQDLAGLSHDDFLSKLDEEDFHAETIGPDAEYPGAKGKYSMVMDDTWYRLTYDGPRSTVNPVDELDVSILQERVFKKILGIHDPQTDPRLSFISGTKGLGALQEATHDGMTVAFALDPPDMEEIMEVADAGLTMPPKSTCFEPKPVSGLIMYIFDAQ